MKKVLIIGAGQLGSRYLQGLSGVDYPLNVFLVDPLKSALDVAVERFSTTSPKNFIQLTSLHTIEELPIEIDLAIVTTTANVRLKVIQDLVCRKQVKNWILEKILFQNILEYEIAEQLFKTQYSKQWVNCAQRVWPFFIELKKHFSNDPDLLILATGSNWGLGCNAVHNTDLAEFLWGSELHHAARFDDVVQQSKRPGFLEFTGSFETHARGGGLLRQASYSQGNRPFGFSVIHPLFHKIWNLSAGKLFESSESTEWKWVEREMVAPLQSEITSQIVTAIFEGKKCGLPSFESSVSLHRETLQTLLDAARHSGHDFGKVCPVT